VDFSVGCADSEDVRGVGAGEVGEVRRGSRKKEKRVGAKQPHAIGDIFLQHTYMHVLQTETPLQCTCLLTFQRFKERRHFDC
jgi:hypothetical protein